MMTEADQLKKIKDGLAHWCQANKGSVHVAHDLPHLVKILGEAAGAPRVGLLVVGEDPRNPDYSDVEGRMDRKFWVAVSRGYTLESYAGKSILEGVAGGKPMFELVAGVRRAIRELRFDIEEEPIPYYRGYGLLNFEGVTLDAVRLEFIICSEIGEEIEEPFDQPDGN